MFKRNESNTDRLIRAIVGAIALIAFFMMPGSGLRWLFLLVGVIGLFTAATGSCLIYTLLGKSTCEMKDS